ncbi:HEAT repeat domain-containing protein [Halomicroarcula sp. F28]|uniref:HEAT repeat domain-containing protein n=1 Tax=Haloarcula salinisoli TaxID=2487746 RepID=UPI001C73A76E|nr:HEAT repeat domain-containing protein [Halomicroarcula salinisoli]MBX0287339.1 HEAT repeat domain-containing protein [Halomicroarcula salinisoli]
MADEEDVEPTVERAKRLAREDLRWVRALGVLDEVPTDEEIDTAADGVVRGTDDPAIAATRLVRHVLVERDRAFRYRYDVAVGDRAYGELFQRHRRIAGGALDGLDYDIEGEGTECARLALTLGETTVSGQFDSRGSSVDPVIFRLVNELLESTPTDRRFERVVTDALSAVAFVTPIQGAAIRLYLEDRTRKLPPAVASSWPVLLADLDASASADRCLVLAVIEDVDPDALPVGEVVTALSDRLAGEADPSVRAACFETLCSLATDHETAADAVVAALGADSLAVRRVAFDGVVESYGHRSDVLPPADPAVKSAVQDAVVAGDDELQSAAVELADSYGVSVSVESVLADAPPPTDAAAEPVVELLKELGPDPAADYVTEALREGETAQLRATAAETLGDVVTVETRDALVAALVDDDPDVRTATVDSLRYFSTQFEPVEPPGDGIPPVLETAFRTDGPPPSKVVTAVGHLDTPTAIDRLCEAASADDPTVQTTAASWLAERPTEEAIPALADLVRADEDELVVELALLGLAKLDHPEANQTFEMAANSDHIEVPRSIEKVWAEHREGRIYTVLGWVMERVGYLLYLVALALLILVYPLVSAFVLVESLLGRGPEGTPMDRWDVARLLLSLCVWAGIGYLLLGTPSATVPL